MAGTDDRGDEGAPRPPHPPPPGWAQPPPPPGWGQPPPPGWGQPPPPGWVPPPGSPAPGWGWGTPLPPQPKAGSARTGPLPLHPMTVGDILDGAFKLLKANGRTVVLITALFTVPVQLLAAYLQRDLLGGESFFDVISDPATAAAASESGDNGQALASVIAVVAAALILPFVAGAISRVVAASYLGEELGPGPALRATLRRWLALVGAWLLVHLLEFSAWILLVGFLLLAATGSGESDAVIVAGAVILGLAGIPVALAFMTLFVAVAPTLVVEELGPVKAMRRSARLLRRRFWGVLGIALLSGFMASVLNSVLGTVPQLVALAVGTGGFGWLLLAVGGILPSLVTTPFIAIVSTLVYFDGRIRHEGFDLEVIAAELARSGVRQ